MDMQELLAATLANGGATFDPRTGMLLQPKRGYAVGMRADTFATLPTDTDADALGAAVTALRYAYPTALVGTWVDGGVIHLDPVEVVASRETAVRLGRERSQLAVYAFATGEEVRLA